MQDDPLRIAAARLRLTVSGDWYDDPVGWATHCIAWPAGQSLTPYQEECLQALVEHRRVAVRGPHGLGKTALQALLVLWFATTRELAARQGKIQGWKIITTAGAWRQLTVFLWPEVHLWAKLVKTDLAGLPKFSKHELLTINLKLNHGQASAVASDDPQLIEGAHAEALLYLFDESKSIGASTFDAAEGALVQQGSYAFAASTPGEPNGRFYDIHARKKGLEDWWVRHVTIDEVLAAGRTDQAWVDQRAEMWGADSGIYANRVLGEFHANDEDGVIPLAWVEAAQLRWREWRDAGEPQSEGAQTVGVDVARGGDDKTMLAIRDDMVVCSLREGSRRDTMELTGQVVGILEKSPARTAIVDVIGIGAGCVDRLRELKQKVLAFSAGEGTDLKDRSGELGFTNCRSAAWWNLREMLDPAFGAQLALPDDDMLTRDLVSPRWRVLSGGKIQVEAKDDIRKRHGRSTDHGDAVVQAVWSGGDGGAEAWIRFMTPKPKPEPESALFPDRQSARRAAFAAGSFR